MGDATVVAVDIGTGSARAIAFSPNGEVVAQRAHDIPTDHPRPGWSQQDPDVVAAATLRAIRDLFRALPDPGSVVSLAFSAQMYSVMVVDGGGRAVTPSLPWADTRATATARELRADPAASRLPAVTGCAVQAIYPLSKIRWLLDNATIPAGSQFVSVKDYVLARLSGTLLADQSTSSASGLLDVATGDWSELALETARISRRQLPSLASPMTPLARTRHDALSTAGVRRDTPVWLGAGDAPLASVGCGAVDSSILAVNIGTSAAARQMIREPVTDASGRLWTYLLDLDHWVTGGIVGSAGASLSHVMQLLGDGPDPVRDVSALAAAVPPGCDGLMFLPYLGGEQSPEWRPASRGALVGLTFRHDRRHIARAVLEGIAFSLQRVSEVLDPDVSQLTKAAVTGGVSRSPVMRQILADVLGLPVLAPVGHEGSARGAAVLAWVASGHAPDLESLGRATIERSVRTDPSPEDHQAYRTAYRRFKVVADQLGTTATEVAP